MKINIFYSWQTSTDARFNRNFIKTCLEKAIKVLNRKPDFLEIEFEILDGVRGEPGSPNVASTIIDKRIPSCDIYIADLSIVNKQSKLEYWANKIFRPKKEHEHLLNPNVLMEYGVAVNSIGYEKIIGVMNSIFGSPKEDPEILPFDIRPLRFPIEYYYSKNTHDLEKVKNELISNLVDALKNIVPIALQTKKDKYYPFMVWKSWEYNLQPSQKFYQNERIIEVNELILKSISGSKANIRLLGLSGLGKTRIVFEIFRPIIGDQDSLIKSSKVLYVNCSSFNEIDFQRILKEIDKNNEDVILILDNCPKIVHREISAFIKGAQSNISLISIDSNPEEVGQDKIIDVNYILIRKEELSSIVDRLIEDNFSNLGKESTDKIKEFSQGIPMMAVLLGQSIRDGEKFIGILKDKELLDKLLGQKGRDDRSRRILKSCSIFSYFGYEDELRSQLEFIASDKNVTSLIGENPVLINDFDEICRYFIKREIFEKKGRLIGMRPLPLALSLAQEWLEQCSTERLIKVIQSIASLKEPDRTQLSEALADQMRYLGYDDNAIYIIEKIVGPGSPFDNAEVLNTELGSRLFRSFVEVNPVAASKNLTRIFANMSREELLKIKEGRRNLVWALEKICFDKRTFSEGAKIMYAFAVAENETWSNNATGQFLHLFKILLSGTEADLEERWKIIEWGFSQTEIEYHSLAVRAMGVGLSYGYFTRTSGSEIQGTKKLFDYEPNTTETEIYWAKILNKLTSIVKSGNDLSNSASEIIANSIRAIFNAGLARIVLPFLKEIAEYKQNDWDEGLRGLRMSRKYEKGSLNKELQIQVDDLVEALTKKDFGSRYLTLEKSYYFDNDGSYNSENIIGAFIELADEFINSKLPWEQYLEIFYKNRINFSFYFGKRIYELISGDGKKVESFMYSSLDIISTISKEERDPTVLAGFVSESVPEVKKQLYSYLGKSEVLNYLSFYFISLDKEGKTYFNLLFKLIDEQKCEIHCFDVFAYSIALKELSLDELNEFSEKLFSYGEEGYEIVFDLFFNIGYDDDELKKELFPVFKKCILKLGYNKKERRQQDGYKWTQTICSILENNDENNLAVFINRSIIDSITYQNSYNIDYDVQRVYEILLKKHFESIWPDLSEALLAEGEEYIKFYGLKLILGAHIGGIVRSSGVLFEGNIDSIFEWCEAKKPLAPIRLAELVPIFGEGNNDYSAWNPITFRLINEFGDIEEVLQTIATNMGNFSWTGSIVPLLKSKKNLFNSIADHKLVPVSQWANKHISYLEMDIKQEKNRDEEMYL